MLRGHAAWPQIQTDLEAAQGTVIWILPSDSQFPVGVVASLRAILKHSNISFGCFHLEFDKSELSCAFICMY